MARPPNTKDKDSYSRMVRVFRVVFPLVAVGLLASIFMLSKKLPAGLIDVPPDVLELALGQKITKPHFSGVTKAGDAFSITAAWALPDAPKPERIELNMPVTTIDFVNGRNLKTRSDSGLLDLAENQAKLSGSVSLVTSDGYDARSDELLMNFETGNAVSPGPVTAIGPFGSISAGSMELRQNLDVNQSGGKGVLLFKNGVKLVYKP